MTCLQRLIILFTVFFLAGPGNLPAAFAVVENQPFIWRKLAPGSSTVEEVFLTRTPQFVMFRDGLIIYRDDDFKKPYKQIRLNSKELGSIYVYMQNNFGLPALTPDRLNRELPYIKSVQKPVYEDDNTRVSIWISMHTPPSLHTYGTKLLAARSVSEKLGPGWKALYELSRFLAVYDHTQATPYIPERVEIAVQVLPSYMADQAGEAVEWTLSDVDLNQAKGKRMRGFKTLQGDAAQRAYKLLTENPIVKSGDTVYLVWVRPLILP